MSLKDEGYFMTDIYDSKNDIQYTEESIIVIEPDKDEEKNGEEDEEKKSIKTVVMSLNKISIFPEINQRINDYVYNNSLIETEAYIFMNMHFMRLIRENKELPSFTQDFFQDVCCVISEMYNKEDSMKYNNEILETFYIYEKCRPENYKAPFRDNNGASINWIKKRLQTATLNHLMLNIFNRFKKYIKNKYNYTGDLTHKFAINVFTKKYSGKNKAVLFWRQQLDIINFTRKNVREDSTKILYFYYHILSFFKEHNSIQTENKNKIRIFSLLPHKSSFTMSYMTISKNVLSDIIRSFRSDDEQYIIQQYTLDDELINEFTSCKKAENHTGFGTTLIRSACKSKSHKSCGYKWKMIQKNSIKIGDKIVFDYIDTPEIYWDLYFQIPNMKKFRGVIMTNGKTSNILYDTIRPIIDSKKEIDLSTIDSFDYDVILGDDPGNIDAFTATWCHDKQSNDYTTFSTKQYYHDAKFNQATFKRNKLYEANKPIQEYFKNMLSNKENDLEEYIKYTTYVLKGVKECLLFHLEKPFRKMRFTSYIHKKKTLNDMCRQLTGKQHKNDNTIKCLIGLGDWCMPKNSILRGHKRGPGKQFERELEKWCDTKISINEYCTSKTCYKCHGLMKKMKYGDVEVNKVLCCTNNKCGLVIDRDINASKNIYYLLSLLFCGRERPKVFCRGSKNEKHRN